MTGGTVISLNQKRPTGALLLNALAVLGKEVIGLPDQGDDDVRHWAMGRVAPGITPWSSHRSGRAH
jgi:hypothetical protein